jgi:hypothetical protein
VAKDTSSDFKDEVVGIAMWMPPRPAELKETWSEWFEGWKMWAQQVKMNLWYGRGGLNVKVGGLVSTSIETNYIDEVTGLCVG